ncbi:hypothetical protein BJY00DRAFT_49185 [Aspergillus carlsbadensis]|nr:hypothetical protein BJY00DRAFT_49185 [Aspergillus carlsbadensis]
MLYLVGLPVQKVPSRGRNTCNMYLPKYWQLGTSLRHSRRTPSPHRIRFSSGGRRTLSSTGLAFYWPPRETLPKFSRGKEQVRSPVFMLETDELALSRDGVMDEPANRCPRQKYLEFSPGFFTRWNQWLHRTTTPHAKGMTRGEIGLDKLFAFCDEGDEDSENDEFEHCDSNRSGIKFSLLGEETMSSPRLTKLLG